jgi:flagellar basal body-associated protein FliL
MGTAMMIILTLNLALTIATYVAVVAMLLQKGEQTKQSKNSTPPKNLSDEEAAEILRAKQEAEKRERYMQNFMSYTGESQLKGGRK